MRRSIHGSPRQGAFRRAGSMPRAQSGTPQLWLALPMWAPAQPPFALLRASRYAADHLRALALRPPIGRSHARPTPQSKRPPDVLSKAQDRRLERAIEQDLTPCDRRKRQGGAHWSKVEHEMKRVPAHRRGRHGTAKTQNQPPFRAGSIPARASKRYFDSSGAELEQIGGLL